MGAGIAARLLLSIDTRFDQEIAVDPTLHAGVYALLCDFQRAFDMRDWDRLTSCLDDRLYIDYSSFRGTPPGEVLREQYVELRRAALSRLRMQHNFSNLQVQMDSATGTAIADCNFAIYRFAEADPIGPQDFFHSFGRYIFRLRDSSAGMRISGITQHVTASYGNPDLHSGAVART